MKSLLLITILSLVLFGLSLAQDTNQEVYPEQVSIEHNAAVKSFSSDFVSAFSGSITIDDLAASVDGITNYAVTNMYGNENISILSQQGYGIAGVINIMGDYNRANLDQQGTDLMSILNIEGAHNIFDMQQHGISLSNQISVIGSGLEFDAFHTNEAFQLYQRGFGAVPLSIEQTGNTIPLIIQNN